MTFLHCSMQEEGISSVLMASVTCLHFCMQQGDISKLINGKCHFVYTLVNL